MNETWSLSQEEELIFSIRTLFRQYGYTQYKMSRFEDYDLYARNKDFLVSDNVITFTDTNGALKALKPDVTLSIIRSLKDSAQSIQKLCYHENVYRVSGTSHTFSEIMQMGLECIGDIDTYCLTEVLFLAASSLKHISGDYLLVISHMGILEELLSLMHIPRELEKEALSLLAGKSVHGFEELLSKCGVSGHEAESFLRLPLLEGTAEEVIPVLREMGCSESSLTLLSRIWNSFTPEMNRHIRFDFSVIHDMRYYNGFVFKGFIRGIPSGILSGGQYDKLLQRMGKSGGAIGFALYLDLLERFFPPRDQGNVDALLLYDKEQEPSVVASAVRSLSSLGLKVLAARERPANLQCKQVFCIRDGGVQVYGTDT